MKLAEFLVQYLIDFGITHFFGVGGANIEDIFDALFSASQASPGLRTILAKHEFSAACMADGFARTSQKLGVVLATSGGGALNLLPGLAESYDSRVPVLAIAGQPPTHLEGKGAFQDTSGLAGTLTLENTLSSVTKYCAKITSIDGFSEKLKKAIEMACTHPRGPVALLIPKDIQVQILSELPSPPLIESLPSLISDQELQDVVSIVQQGLRNRKTPVIIVGNDAQESHIFQEVLRLSQLTGAKVAATPGAKNCFPSGHPQFIGLVGVMGNLSVVSHLREASATFIIGTSLPAMSQYGLTESLLEKPLIYMGNRAECFAPSSKIYRWVGDLYTALERLNSFARACNLEPPLSDHSPLHFDSHHLPARFFEEYSDFNFKSIIDIISDWIEPNANVVVDAGNCGASVMHYLRPPEKGQVLIALGMGGMGYSFGAGIGSVCANKNRTYIIAGDGAFFMHGFEVHTAIEYHLPITFIIFNNNSHAMCYTREKVYYQGRYSFNLFQPTLIGEGISAMFKTMPSRSIRTLDELKNGVSELRNTQGPVFLSLEMDPKEIPPFIPFIDALEKQPGKKV